MVIATPEKQRVNYYGKTFQLRPEVVRQQLNHGKQLTEADGIRRTELANHWGLTSARVAERESVYVMFKDDDIELIEKLPWTLLVNLSQKTKDFGLRRKLADLVLYWAHLHWEGLQPSNFSISPEKNLVQAIMKNLELYREPISILHAKMKQERGLELTDQERQLAAITLPDIADIVAQVESSSGQDVVPAISYETQIAQALALPAATTERPLTTRDVIPVPVHNTVDYEGLMDRMMLLQQPLTEVLTALNAVAESIQNGHRAALDTIANQRQIIANLHEDRAEQQARIHLLEHTIATQRERARNFAAMLAEA